MSGRESRPSPRRRRRLGGGIPGAVCLLLSLVGCGPYVLRGKVIDGGVSEIAFVRADDPRLGWPGLDDATAELILDPQTLGRRTVAQTRIAPDGTFELPIEEFGAGVLEYEFGLVVRRAGFDSAVEHFRLPPRDRLVLVTLARGPDRYRPPEDPLGESKTFLRD